MSYAPGVLLELKSYAVRNLAAPANGVGIVGDTGHKGGYHLGLDRLMQGKAWNDFSATRPRDVAALKGPTRDAATALDLTCQSRNHRAWLARLVTDFRKGDPYTLDIRAINGTLDGKRALRWDREHGFDPIATDSSHLWHSHIEWYRDAIADGRPQLLVLKKFFDPVRALHRKAPGPELMSIKTLPGRDPAGRWTWAQLIDQFYRPPIPSGALLGAAAAALRRANAGRPPRSDGSSTWETVGVRVTVTVPATLDY